MWKVKRSFPILAPVLLLAMLMFVYCVDSDETTAPVDPLAGATLCLSDSSCALSAQCDTSTVITVTNCGNSSVFSWSAASDSTWLGIYPESGGSPGEFSITADSNRTGAERIATATVTASGLTDSSVAITVTQPTVEPTLCVSLSQWEAYCRGEESPAISVTNCGDASSFDWVVAKDVDWLALSPLAGSTPGSFNITVETNNTGLPRTGTAYVCATAAEIPSAAWEITVDQPCVLSLAGSYDTPGEAYGVFVSGDYAYVADSYVGGLQIIDISNPSSPVLAGSCDTPGHANGVYVSGNYAYVTDGSSGLQIVDVSNPSSPVLAGSYRAPTGRAYDVFVSGNYAYVANESGGLLIIDISNPSSPFLVGREGTLNEAHGVFVSGDYAYVAESDVGFLEIIDISDPSSPVLAGWYITYDARGVFVSGDYAHVADAQNGLLILDNTDPSSPVLAGSYDTPGFALDVFVSGDFAYVADSDGGGLQVVDISDPSSPVLAGSYDTEDHAFGVFVSGDYAYVADGASGLVILEMGL